MCSCWLESPADRPAFSSLAITVDQLRAAIFTITHTKPRRSLRSRVSRILSRLMRRPAPRLNLDHQTRAAVLSLVAGGSLTIEQCQQVLLEFERGLLQGPPCPPGEAYAAALVQRHQALCQGGVNPLARTESIRTLERVNGAAHEYGLQEEDIALDHTMADTLPVRSSQC